MKLKKIAIGIILFLSTLTFAQTTIDPFVTSSLFVDQKGKICDNYIEPDYSPNQPAEVIFNVVTSYIPGKVYLKDGSVKKGLVKYNQRGRKLLFKDLYSNSSLKFKTDDCIGFTLLKDTFTVIRNFEVLKKRSEFAISDNEKMMYFKKPKFVEVLGDNLEFSVYKFIDITHNGGVPSTFFLMYDKKKKLLKDVSDQNKNWYQDIKPMLTNGLNIRDPKDETFRKLFRESNFINKIGKDEKLYFSPYLIEVNDKSKAMYQVSVKREMYWEFSFKALDDRLVMTHCYKSILPYEKSEFSTYYYPNGGVRKIAINKEGKEVAAKRYHPNGNLHYEIIQNSIEKKQAIIERYNDIIKDTDDGLSKDDFNVICRSLTESEDDKEHGTIYLCVCDSLGNKLLDDNGNGTEKLYDSVSERFIYVKYEANQLKEAYYINAEGKKVYQYCERPLKVHGLNNLQSLKQQVLKTNWVNFPVGTVFVSFVVDEDANVQTFNVLNAVDPKLDAILHGYLYY
ncbi:MAG: hypothetical protein MI866_02955, partial [Bacteroidales bacterium]|nr:hypothetical protein [Bacteroidales bacterium]